MSEIIIQNAVSRTLKDKMRYNYKLDKDGNLIKEKYNFLKDPYSLVLLCVILMGVLYYTSIVNNPLTVNNIDATCGNLTEICGRYIILKEDWVKANPGGDLDVRKVIESRITIETEYKPINITNIKLG